MLGAGLVIPLIAWQTTMVTPAILQQAVVNTTYTAPDFTPIIGEQQHVQQASIINTSTVLWSLYLLGVLISSIVLLRDIYKIMRLLRNGDKEKCIGYWLVETNEHIMPFSLFSHIFISRKEKYSESELALIISHELKHIQHRHGIDMVVIQLLQVVFWFNPLIYLYKKSLQMIHEYQADNIEYGSPQHYGRFLIEQALLPAGPTLSHSLAHSPLKNRLVMLTKKSKKTAQIKMLLVIPVIVLSGIMFSNCKNTNVSPDATAPVKKGNTATYKNNTITLEVKTPDTTTVYESITGEPQIVISYYADKPLTLNGETIYTIYPAPTSLMVDEFPTLPKWNNLGEYLFHHLKDDFEKLDDGKYNMLFANMVINEKGELVFYDYSGIQRFGEEYNEAEGPYLASHMDNKVVFLLYNAPKFTPAKIDGKNVPCSFFGLFNTGAQPSLHGSYVIVENHSAKVFYKTPEKY